MSEKDIVSHQKATGKPWKLALWVGWQLLSAVAIVLVASNVQLRSQFWNLSANMRFYIGSLALAYLLAAVVLAWKMFWNSRVGIRDVVVVVSGSFALCGLCLFLIAYGPYSRSIFVGALGTSYVLSSLPLVLKHRLGKLAALVLLIAVGGLSVLRGGAAADNRPSTVEKKFETSALHNVVLTIYHDVVPSELTGGATKPLGDGYLSASGDGALYYFEKPQEGPLAVRILPYRVPMNRSEFLEDKTEKASDSMRVADILLQVDGQRLRLFASHHYWNRKDQCYVARVSETQADRESFLQGKAAVEWKTVYDTKPCMNLNSTRFLFVGGQIGGRMVQLDEKSILLTVGDGEYDGWNSKLNYPQDPAADWGKTIRINVNDGTATVFTSGHRNAQGIYAMPNGEIWMTEHGPRGGDELNLLKEGTNYGWPLTTYGTQYGTLMWPLSKDQGRHTGYERPVHAWVPSIGISGVIGLQKDLFNLWRGDLLIGTLRERTLFRARLDNRQVVYVEPIMKIGRPIRDLVEGPDGRIVLLFDGGDIGVLDHIAPDGTPAVADNEPDHISIVIGQCKGCHNFGDGTNHAAGPDLHGIVGRRIASAPGYSYSSALTKLTGRWTRERLDEFLHDPASYAPGTVMQSDVLPDDETRKDLIDYLETQK